MKTFYKLDIDKLHKFISQNKKSRILDLIIAIQNLDFNDEINIVYSSYNLKTIIEMIIEFCEVLDFNITDISQNKIVLDDKIIHLYESRPYGVDFDLIFKI